MNRLPEELNAALLEREKRIAELQAENARLRAEQAALRRKLEHARRPPLSPADEAENMAQERMRYQGA